MPEVKCPRDRTSLSHLSCACYTIMAMNGEEQDNWISFPQQMLDEDKIVAVAIEVATSVFLLFASNK
jgi:hypothetical protein